MTDDFSFLGNMLDEVYEEPLPKTTEEYVNDIHQYFPEHKLFDKNKTNVVVKHMLRMLDELSEFDENLSPEDCTRMSKEFEKTVHQITKDMSRYPMWIHHYKAKKIN